MHGILSTYGVDILDVVTPANFGNHRFRRFRMAGVEFKVFIAFQRRPYNTLALPCQRVINTCRVVAADSEIGRQWIAIRRTSRSLLLRYLGNCL